MSIVGKHIIVRFSYLECTCFLVEIITTFDSVSWIEPTHDHFANPHPFSTQPPFICKALAKEQLAKYKCANVLSERLQHFALIRILA
jgi:hypothetical protein